MSKKFKFDWTDYLDIDLDFLKPKFKKYPVRFICCSRCGNFFLNTDGCPFCKLKGEFDE